MSLVDSQNDTRKLYLLKCKSHASICEKLFRKFTHRAFFVVKQKVQYIEPLFEIENEIGQIKERIVHIVFTIKLKFSKIEIDASKKNQIHYLDYNEYLEFINYLFHHDKFIKYSKYFDRDKLKYKVCIPISVGDHAHTFSRNVNYNNNTLSRRNIKSSLFSNMSDYDKCFYLLDIFATENGIMRMVDGQDWIHIKEHVLCEILHMLFDVSVEFQLRDKKVGGFRERADGSMDLFIAEMSDDLQNDFQCNSLFMRRCSEDDSNIYFCSSIGYFFSL